MNPRWKRTKPPSENEVLIAISVERFQDHPLFAPPYGLCKQAIISGRSTDSGASFRFETCPLPPAQMERFERLLEHGFTVSTAPPDWRYQYPPQKWHNKLIVDALARVAESPLEQQLSRPSGYDRELAKTIMELLNEAYPEATTLIQLKYQLNEEPSDEVLATALNALRGDGYIDGARVLYGKPKLNPLERTTLTAEGRRHLADEMKRRNKSRQGILNNDASRSILSQLLAEFRERQLTASDLRSTYKGIPPKEVRGRSISEGISEVDFDLAISDLMSNNLVDTGPKEPVKNDPYSGVYFVGIFTSKNEYSFLTEDGYREAVRLASSGGEPRTAKRPPTQPAVVHGDQYINYGQAGAIGPHSAGTVNLHQQWAAIQNEVDLNALTDELEQLRKRLQQSASSSSDYQQLVSLSEAEEHAKKREGGKAMEALSRVGKGALGAAKDIGTEIAAKVIARSLGIEP